MKALNAHDDSDETKKVIKYPKFDMFPMEDGHDIP